MALPVALAGSLLSNGDFMNNINPASDVYKRNGKYSTKGWKDWFMSNLTGNIFGSKGGKEDKFEIPKYEGLRPYSGADVGLSAEDLKPLSQQYRSQLLERSRGEGLVGYDPQHKALLKSELQRDLEEANKERRIKEQAQSASQGLRGGIPLDISRQRDEDYFDSLTTGLSSIDINDLEARREDINKATYEQPGLVELGSNIQRNRANFDLSEWEGIPIIDQEPNNTTPAVMSALGMALGSYFGNSKTPGQTPIKTPSQTPIKSPNRSMGTYDDYTNLRKALEYQQGVGRRF